MTAIPEDIMQAAREAVASVWGESGAWASRLVRCVRLGEKDGMMSVEIAARAILAERERCAGIADRMAENALFDGMATAYAVAATAIRSPLAESWKRIEERQRAIRSQKDAG